MSAIRVSAVSVLSLLFASAALSQTASAPAPVKMSKVRIVRLSEVRGEVQMDRRTGQGFEPAIANLPIVEETKVRTASGVAEVEFEDNSTLRIGPDSAVAFPILERAPSGATVTEAQLLRGTAYVSMVKGSANQITLLFGSPGKFEKLQLAAGSHIRLQAGPQTADLAVFSGSAHLTSPDGDMDVLAKHTASVSLQTVSTPQVAKNIAPETLDSWDKQASDYHARVATMSAFNNSPYAFGMNDLSYYGSFMNAGGCGTMWRPYFASAAWDPYANGTWAYYPGNGYSWVSPYPWGWMPYHYGSWGFCPGMGWGWMPGGMWNDLNNVNVPATTTGIAGGSTGNGPGLRILPHPPLHPPQRGTTLMQVNLKPLVASNIDSRNSFVFRRDSAGLGVPREGLGKLNGFSHSTLQHGMSTTPVYVTAGPAPGLAGGRVAMGGGSNIAPVMIHRGTPPPSSPGWAGMSGRGESGGSAGISAASGSAPAPTMSSGPVYTGGGNMGGGGARMGGGSAPSAPSAGGGARPH